MNPAMLISMMKSGNPSAMFLQMAAGAGLLDDPKVCAMAERLASGGFERSSITAHETGVSTEEAVAVRSSLPDGELEAIIVFRPKKTVDSRKIP